MRIRYGLALGGFVAALISAGCGSGGQASDDDGIGSGDDNGGNEEGVGGNPDARPDGHSGHGGGGNDGGIGQGGRGGEASRGNDPGDDDNDDDDDQGEGSGGTGHGGSGGSWGGGGNGGSGGSWGGGGSNDGSAGSGAGDDHGNDPGNGSGGAGAGSGGENEGKKACRILKRHVEEALAEAQSCSTKENKSPATCDVVVPGMCCAEIVAAADAHKIGAYLGRLNAYFHACGAPACENVVCSSGAGYCDQNGRCATGD